MFDVMYDFGVVDIVYQECEQMYDDYFGGFQFFVLEDYWFGEVIVLEIIEVKCYVVIEYLQVFDFFGQ